jgi:hypothetical protein
MPSCSKAPRGLLVLLRTDGIFTVNALSPSSSLRQYPYHYSIRAGQNLPDKEFRYLRTVIVTAAVHWGFSSSREALPLTFQHRAGVSPYTSTFVLAETCVFGKQLHGFFSCGPAAVKTMSMDCFYGVKPFKTAIRGASLALHDRIYCVHCGRAVLIPKLRTLFCRVP